MQAEEEEEPEVRQDARAALQGLWAAGLPTRLYVLRTVLQVRRHGHYARCCGEGDYEMVRQVEARPEWKRVCKTVTFEDEQLFEKKMVKRVRSLERFKARQAAERDRQREEGRGSKTMLRKYEELTGRVEVMEENMKELEVESLKKRNRVWQLKEENQKKTAQIKELQPVGGGVHHHGPRPGQRPRQHAEGGAVDREERQGEGPGHPDHRQRLRVR